MHWAISFPNNHQHQFGIILVAFRFGAKTYRYIIQHGLLCFSFGVQIQVFWPGFACSWSIESDYGHDNNQVEEHSIIINKTETRSGRDLAHYIYVRRCCQQVFLFFCHTITATHLFMLKIIYNQIILVYQPLPIYIYTLDGTAVKVFFPTSLIRLVLVNILASGRTNIAYFMFPIRILCTVIRTVGCVHDAATDRLIISWSELVGHAHNAFF